MLSEAEHVLKGGKVQFVLVHALQKCADHSRVCEIKCREISIHTTYLLVWSTLLGVLPDWDCGS